MSIRISISDHILFLSSDNYFSSIVVHRTRCFRVFIRSDQNHLLRRFAKKTFSDLKSAAQKEFFTIDVDAIKDKATEATSTLVEKAGEFKDAAVAVKDDIAEKLTELDRMLQESVTE